MSYLCVHLDGIYYRCFIKYSFDKSCTYLATLAREHRSGRLDLKWYITNEKRLDPSTYEYIAEVLELPTSIWYWDKVPGETPTIHGNDGIWVHNLDLDRGYYTARTWRLPSDGAPYELDDDSEGPLVISWERPRLGDIAVSLDKFEALENFYWNELASLPQLGAKVLPMRKYQRPSDKPLQVSQVSSSTRSVLVNLVFCVITDFASQWYALLFETILSERLTLHFVSAYLLLAVWDVDLELNMGGGSVAATSFPTWPTVGQEDQITFWYRGVIVAAVTDMENESQRSEAILRARSAYEAVYLKSKGDEMEKGFGLVISSKHLIVIEFGQKDHKVSDCHPIFTENCTNVMQVRGHCQRVFGRASVNISTIETLISVFHQASCLKQQAKEQHNRLLDLPPELRKAVFDLLDRKSFDSVAKAVPALLTEYWYHPVINDNQRIASVVEENDGFEPLRLMKLRFENEAFIDSSGREEAVNPVSDVWSGGQDGRLRTVQSLQGGNSNTTKSHRFDIDHQRINLSNSVNQQPRRRATAELNHGNTHVPHMTAMRTYHFFSYLELDVFRALFAQEQHREYVTKAIASALLTWYFPLQEGYCVAPEQERSRNTPDFIIYTVKHNVGHIDLYDCVFIEVKRNHLDAETQVWNACEQTENDSGVCYACTFNQWDLKFYRFVHRLNSIGEPASRTPFSDKIDIRYEAQEVDRMFDYMRKNPLPYY